VIVSSENVRTVVSLSLVWRVTVERFLADATNRMRAGNRFVREKPADLWTRQAAAEAGRWRRRYADRDIPPLLKQAIRLDPFLIRRG